MMLEELGLVVDDSNPLTGGIITFFAFALFGLLPLIPYIIGSGIVHDETNQYTIISLIIGGIELFSLGFAKALLIGLNKFLNGL
jgi:vacuolar iron transporter family protein